MAGASLRLSARAGGGLSILSQSEGFLIGAGVRLVAQNTLLLEKLVNIAHTDAPQAKLCFNTKPTDTAEAVQRWVPPSAPS